MLRVRSGIAGSAAGANAAARYFLSETLRPENEILARYYAGESISEESIPGMDHLGRAVAAGDLEFSAALDELMSAHGRLFGFPQNVEGLEERLTEYLVKAAGRADKRETLAAEGGTVARVREDLDPRLAKRLGIDMSRPLTQAELGHLLAGERTDGQAIEGKQMQKPMKSVVEVFGLDAKGLPTPAEIDHVLAAQRVDGEAARSAQGNGEPIANTTVQGARKRFLGAYSLSSHTDLTPQHVDHIKAGRTANGGFLDEGDVLRKLNAVKAPISYTDCIWSAEKSVTVAWALAPTEAERTIIQQAHRDAVATSMAYLETHLGFTTKGKGGRDGVEPGATAWVSCDHYTSRPTAEIAMTDKDGQPYTEFETIPMRVADPQLHTHALLLNAVLTESGRLGSMDLDRLDGLVKEMGGVYQARLARNLREHGIDAVLDPKTGAARIVDVPTRVAEHFSKRSHDIEAAARRYAAEEGHDWQTMAGAHKLKFLRRGVEETRQQKRHHDGDSDFTSWRKQAEDEIGYRHRSVMRHGQEQALRPEVERQRHAYEVSLPLIEEALAGKAKLDATDFREFATRGLIEAGIGDDPGRDIKAVMRLYREHGVRQNGQMVPIQFGKDTPIRGKERWSVTTAMHVGEEKMVVELARAFSADRSRALSHDALERALQAYLASNPKIDPNSPQWIKQREVIDQLGTGGRLGIAIGVAGAGKTTLLSPVVSAMREDGRHVHGIARGWKQAAALRDSGIEQNDAHAVSAFLKKINKGRVKLDSNSVVIIDELSQVSRNDALELLQLQQKHGFTMLAIGDPKQIGSIEAPVMDLLVKTLGDKVPKTSVRQSTEREREISGLFRDGKAREAIAMKRDDRTAELVAGGRHPTIERVAAKWMELTQADPTLTPSIGVATNRDAHDIGVAVRKQLQDAGKIGADKIDLQVMMRGESDLQTMPLAQGDRVRVFNRVWSKGHFASNGDVLTILDASTDGMKARNDAGAEAFVGWTGLQGRDDPAPKLAYGHALTIDASQGTTSRRHIDAVLSGSWLHQGGKGYVNESRQVETTHLIVNEAAERKKIFSRVPRGEHRIVRDDDIWKHVADSMSRLTTKANALDFVRAGTEIHRGGLSALPAALEPAERRERAGQERMTLRHRMERVSAEIAPVVRKALDYAHQIQQRLAPARRQELTSAQREQHQEHPYQGRRL
jgi:hypothetical protein